MDSKPTSQSDRRIADRQSIVGDVSVEIVEQIVLGPGQNVSVEGLYFETDASLRVRVKIPDENGWREGQLVRVQPMSGGKTGVAIKFH